jgi:hypothetical protein
MESSIPRFLDDESNFDCDRSLVYSPDLLYVCLEYKHGSDKVRLAARERGYDWDRMSDDEQEAFIDEVVHEK